MAQPVTIRGVRYPSQVAAASALGLCMQTIAVARQRGTLDRCGLRLVGPIPATVRVRGQVFPDAKAAAAAFGIKPKSVYAAIERGGEDRLGLPRQMPRNVHAKPFTIGGLSFPSMAAASRALGFRAEYVAKALAKNCATAKQRILGAAMAEAAKREKAAQKSSDDRGAEWQS